MFVILLGPPGSGKGTQAERLSQVLRLTHISTGDILRNAIAKGEPLGVKAKEYTTRGTLVPDEIMIGIIKNRIQQKDCGRGCILDGFPRTVEQARVLDTVVPKIDKIINIDVPEDVLIKRLASRRTCQQCGANYNLEYQPPKTDARCDVCGGNLYQRPDDQPETIKQRLKVYEEQTKPILDYYQKRLKTVSGDQSIEGVFKEIKEAVSLPR